MRFRHGQENRMILRLRATIGDNHASAGVDSCVCKDLEKECLGDVIGTGTRDEEAARLQQLQGAKVNLLIASLGCRDTIAMLGESRWVEDHHLEFAAYIVVLL